MINDQKGVEQSSGKDFAISKEFIVLVPLLGSALAIIYDSGFFTGLNTHYFTFFSLNEHIVFALAVLPPALLFALVICFVYLARTPKRRPMSLRRLIAGIALALSLTAFGYFLFRATDLAVLTGIMCGLTLLFGWSQRLTSRLIFGCMTAAFVAFSLGYADAGSVLELYKPSSILGYFQRQQLKTIVLTKNDAAIEARLIRSGDRGVLFLDIKNKELTLLRWDEIKQISTVPR